MLRHLAAALVCVSAVAAACSSGGVPEVPAGPGGEPDPVLVAGRQTYIERCGNCHGDDGGGGQGPKLSEGAAVTRYPDIAEQIAVVANGVRAMPDFAGTLTSVEIEAVVRYAREVL